MKMCNGCKHLVTWRGNGWCREAQAPHMRIVDPTTGTYWDKPQYKYGLSEITGSKTTLCRAPGMPCGPDRKLYEPKLLARLFPWLYD